MESYYGAGGGLSHASFHGKKAANSNQAPSISTILILHHPGHDCSCSEGGGEGMCNTLGLDQVREGHAKYWCYVDKTSTCVDMQESFSEQGRFYSFQACASK